MKSPTNTPSLLSIRDLTVCLQQGKKLNPVVKQLDLDIKSGEMLALVGESGSGKSLTALAILGLLPIVGKVTSGQIIFDGKNLLDNTQTEWQHLRGKRIAMVFQEPMTALNPVLTVRQQINEVLKAHTTLSRQERLQRCLDLLQQVGMPDPKRCLTSYPHQLSGGMRQRVLMAIALACEPELLLADEPTTALDVTVQAQIMEILDNLRKKKGTAILFITHNLALASQYADRCAVMYGGCLLETTNIQDIRSKALHPYTRLLLQSMPNNSSPNQPLQTIPGQVPLPGEITEGCAFAPRCPLATEKCRAEAPVLSESEPGHCVSCHFAGQALPDKIADSSAAENARSETPLLDVRNLTVTYPVYDNFTQRKKGTVHAVNNLDFQLYSGETLALVGESGCGKSTVAKALVHLVPKKSGKAIWEGKKNLLSRFMVSLTLSIYKYWHFVQMIFQDPDSSFDPRLMVSESLEEAMVSRRFKTAEKKKFLEELMSEVGLSPEMLNRYPHQFSGGQRQRLGLARALAAEPKVIICDECTSALDVSVQAQILNRLKELQRKRNLAYLFITHDLSVVSYLADRVAVMYLGSILEEGTTAEIFSHPQHPYTKALLDSAPVFDADGRAKLKLSGEVPSAIKLPTGCPFHPRCQRATPECSKKLPPFQQFSPTHKCRCFYPNEYSWAAPQISTP